MNTKFAKQYPDYPLNTSQLMVEYCEVSDSDIPSGSGGINSERYTYGELRHQPIIPKIAYRNNNPYVEAFIEECNGRNKTEGFSMFKVNGEYCFWGLRVGPVVKAPSVAEIRNILQENPKTAEILEAGNITAPMIRDITHTILRQAIANHCGVSVNEASDIIGNQLDCAPHEDISGYLFMVPNWAHRWFRHDGYVSQILQEI